MLAHHPQPRQRSLDPASRRACLAPDAAATRSATRQASPGAIPTARPAAPWYFAYVVVSQEARALPPPPLLLPPPPCAAAAASASGLQGSSSLNCPLLGSPRGTPLPAACLEAAPSWMPPLLLLLLALCCCCCCCCCCWRGDWRRKGSMPGPAPPAAVPSSPVSARCWPVRQAGMGTEAGPGLKVAHDMALAARGTSLRCLPSSAPARLCSP